LRWWRLRLPHAHADQAAISPKETKMELTMASNQNSTLHLHGTGVAGGDTTAGFSGRAAWADDGAGILQLTPDATGLACKAVALGLTGTSVVTVSATDPKGNAFSASVTVTVNPPLEDTASIEIVADAPVDN
jgi:hypothetical protein